MSFKLPSSPTGYGFPYTVDPGIIRFGTDAIAMSLNSSFFSRSLYGGTISKVGLEVVAQNGSISVGAYRNNGVGRNSTPTGGLLASSGIVSCPAPGYSEVSLGTNVTLQPGDWLALSADNITATFRSLLNSTGVNNLGLGRQLKHNVHPLPAVPIGTPMTGYTIVLIGVA